MTLSRRGCRAGRFWPEPCHHFEVENIQVVEVLFAVPSSEHEHLCALNQICRVTIPSKRCPSSLWPLIPGHRDRVQSMKVSKCFIFVSLASKDNDARPCQDCCVIVSRLRRSPLDLRLYPTAGIQVKYVSIVKVDIALLLPSIEMTLNRLEMMLILQSRGLMLLSEWLSGLLEDKVGHLRFVETPKTIFFLKLK